MEPLRVFIGVDSRQPVAGMVAAHSVARHSSVPVAITLLMLDQLPIKRRGLTEFTYSRFLVPWLCDFKGQAVFMDADMIVTGDIAELFTHLGGNSVAVMQQQERFEWASLMVFNCSACLQLTPEFIDDPKNPLFDLAWAKYIGNLPYEWSHCVGYASPYHAERAKLLHYTRGLPVWPETDDTPEADKWFAEAEAATATCSYDELMGRSIHHERKTA